MAKVENSEKQYSGSTFVHFSSNEMKRHSSLHIFGFTKFIYSVCLASGRKNQLVCNPSDLLLKLLYEVDRFGSKHFLSQWSSFSNLVGNRKKKNQHLPV